MAEEQCYTWTLEVEGAVEVPVRRLYLASGTYTVGAGQRCDLVVPADGVSRKHLQIEVPDGGGLLVEDLGSRNGTFIDGGRIRRAALAAATRLTLGSVTISAVPLVAGGGHLAIAMAGQTGAGSSASDSDGIHRPTTRAQSLEELLIGHLAEALAAGDGPAPAAVARVLHEWCSQLGLTGIELVRQSDGSESVVAMEGDCAGEPALEVDGGIGAKIRVFSPSAVIAGRLEPFFAVAVHALGGSAGGAVVDASRHEKKGLRPMPAPGSSNQELVEIFRTSGRIARGEIPVLILGESGTGKEVLARWLHDGSPRADGPFLAVNCAALPSDLLEAELFGIEKGVATGVEERPGILERAHGGTVFLDELGDMALETQAKVLRVLENTSVYRVGGRQSLEIDVRFLAATNQPVADMVEGNELRLDLYHRLAAYEVQVPPLRERREDVPRLAAHFLGECLRKTGLTSPGITRAALAHLIAFEWPGNVRQLQQEISRAVLLLEPGEPLDVCHLSDRIATAGEKDRGSCSLSLAAAVVRAELQALKVARAAAGDDHARATELLEVSRATYYRKLREHGLTEDSD